MAKGGFRGGSRGGGGMNQMQMMKQAQKMQEDLLKMQEELQQAEYTATSGGGAVSVTVTGSRQIKALTISPDAVDPDDVEMLQDLIIAAVNEAMNKADTSASENMNRLTGGLNLSGLGL